MRVFISWSGKRSGAVAELLRGWIKQIVQATDPFISSEDIEKGSNWFGAVADSLAQTNAGVIVLTAENLRSPWILFEAGALFKGLTKARVWTLLADEIDPVRDLPPPLSQFNATRPTKPDMFRLMTAINSALGDRAVPREVLSESFETFWPKFEMKFKAILGAHAPAQQTRRSSEEMTVEVLAIVRKLQKSIQELPSNTSSSIPDEFRPIGE